MGAGTVASTHLDNAGFVERVEQRGNMRKSKGKAGQKPKSTYLEIALWRAPGGTAIHVASNDPAAPTFHVIVRKDPAKASGHPYLWRELDKCLTLNGM
jgi:hypothetical protein